MKRNSEGELTYLQFDLFEPFPKLVHGIFLRHGGVSEGSYKSLNLSPYVGDRPSHVEENCARVKKVLGLERLFGSKQPHDKVVSEVTHESAAEQALCDAFCTDHPGLGMLSRHADCQTAIFYDPKKHVAAVVHAGWKGSVLNIYRETIHTMRKRYGAQPENLFVGIGPSLGPEAAEFVNYRKELPEEFWEYQVSPNYFDFWAISEAQLKEEGVLDAHIEIMRICTYSHPEDYFSYRRENVTGRHGTVAALL